MKKKLERQIKKIEKSIKKGDRINLMYDGEIIEHYDFTEWSADAKTPLDWLRGCFCFEISLKGRDINKVEIEYLPK